MEFYKPSHSDDERHKIIDAINLKTVANDQMLDLIVECAKTICDAPIALITLVHRNRQWHMARSGLDTSDLEIQHSFCRHNISDGEVMEVHDASIDPRFANNPLVVGELRVRFYAGIPVVVQGTVVGRLCVLDRAVRILGHKQRQALMRLSDIASLHLQTVYRNRRPVKKQSSQSGENGKLGAFVKRQLATVELARRAAADATSLKSSLLTTIRSGIDEAAMRVSSEMEFIIGQAFSGELSQAAALAKKSFTTAADLSLHLIASTEKEQQLLSIRPVALELERFLSQIELNLQWEMEERSIQLTVMFDDHLPKWVSIEAQALRHLVESLLIDAVAGAHQQRDARKILLIVDLSAPAELRIQLICHNHPFDPNKTAEGSHSDIDVSLAASVKSAAYSFGTAKRLAKAFGWGFSIHESRSLGSIVSVMIPFKTVAQAEPAR